MTLLLLLLACGSPEPQSEAASGAEAAPTGDLMSDGHAMLKARAAAKKLGGTLKTQVLEGLAAGSPADTLQMCSEEAQGMTALVAGESDVKVGRTSDKLRNPANAGPDWVLAWLAENKATAPADIKPYAQAVNTPEGRVARVASPIVIAEPCLVCHGEVDEEVKAKLATAYPSDAATGYAAGDLRGAIWAEAAVAVEE